MKLNTKEALALGYLIVIMIAALFSNWFTHYAFDAQNLEESLQSASTLHIMGTDSLGRDLFSRILFGSRVSLAVGVLTAFISLGLGLLIGTLAGYIGGMVDELLMRMAEMFYVFPTLLISILMTLWLGHSILGIVLSLSLVSWASVARLVRGQVLVIKNMVHIEAARSLGCSNFWLFYRHILPLMVAPLIVAVAYQVPSNILAESFLSFIGLGVQPPYASWGSLANEGWRAARSYPHLIIFPGFILFFTLLALQVLSEAIKKNYDTTHP